MSYGQVEADEGNLGFRSEPNLAPLTAAFLDANPAGPSRVAAPQTDVPYAPFNRAYYQTYFDIDTHVVLKRAGLAMFPRDNFIDEVCDGQIDLYGTYFQF